MLPGPARLRRSADFAAVLRGRDVSHAGRGAVVVHLAHGSAPADGQRAEPTAGPRVGFVVSGAVGNAVVRHRITRQLRHIWRDRLDQLPPDARVVVRARPNAAGRSSTALARDVDAALRAIGAGR
jgi:ribonuclease P protein component